MTALVVPHVGCWYYYCCEHDLTQVGTSDELAELIEDNAEHLEEFGRPLYQFFVTREDALSDMGPAGWKDGSSSEGSYA